MGDSDRKCYTSIAYGYVLRARGRRRGYARRLSGSAQDCGRCGFAGGADCAPLTFLGDRSFIVTVCGSVNRLLCRKLGYDGVCYNPWWMLRWRALRERRALRLRDHAVELWDYQL